MLDAELYGSGSPACRFRDVALLVGVLLAAPAHGDFDRAYTRGIKAARSGDWATVVTTMAEAIAEQPDESPKKRMRGLVYDKYLPHFYRGLALSKLGKCRDAQGEWSIAEHQGVIQQLGEYGELQTARRGCVAAAITEADGTTQRVDQLCANPTLPRAALSTVADRRAQARADCSSARACARCRRSPIGGRRRAHCCNRRAASPRPTIRGR